MFQKSKDVKNDLNSRFKHRDGVISAALSPDDVDSNEDNPHVDMILDKRSAAKEERRGEIPAREGGIRIDIVEQSPENETAECTPQRKESAERKYPGGLESPIGSNIINAGGTCTNGSRFINGSFHDFGFGWSVAHHCLNNCDGDDPDGDGEGGYHPAFPTTQRYGNVVYTAPEYDIAYIEPNRDFEPLSKVVRPNNHSESRHISGTVSEDGVGFVADNNLAVTIWGVTTCEAWGEITRWGFDMTPNDYCANELIKRIEIRNPVDQSTTDGGDSGTTWWVREPSSGDYFAIASHQGSTPDLMRGGSGYGVRDDHNIW
ncbi:MAG: hypothetical protein ACI80F_002483, partial [Natronomonas sp.]